jgi:hypothetical protein
MRPRNVNRLVRIARIRCGSLAAKFNGRQVSEMASSLLRLELTPPLNTSDTLTRIQSLGAQNPYLDFNVAWQNERYDQALVILYSALQVGISRQ